MCQSLLPRAIARFRHLHPEIRIVLQTLIPAVMEQSLLTQQVELGVAYMPVNHPSLATRPLYENRIVAVLPAGLLIEPDVHPDLVLTADTDRIAQVVTNLMSNARQHGAPRMPIHVSAMPRGDTIELTVANHGAPIPDDTSLCGLTAHAQAVVFGSPGPTLTNALELVLGQ